MYPQQPDPQQPYAQPQYAQQPYPLQQYPQASYPQQPYPQAQPAYGPPVHYRWVAGPGDAGRLARDTFVAWTTEPLALIFDAIAVVVVLGLVLLNVADGDGGAGALKPIVGWGVIFALLFGIRFLSLRFKYGKVAAPGASWTLGFTPNSVVITSPHGIQNIHFALIKPPKRVGQSFYLPNRSIGATGITLPGGLLPPDALNHLQRSATG
ncbi:hypothetical protein [Williamsia sp. CHRR-6]|uniref:hypothetical protein n=1 Tax=Williamsia sp. CHRR-6 TaxID=2835871 RepID=UPI001BDADF3F|nr:hypothetical protein [Williamsia sp. CHRR-6]MBT0566727.1 hypothetical protein [Williamsia sp. CHRR-6]